MLGVFPSDHFTIEQEGEWDVWTAREAVSEWSSARLSLIFFSKHPSFPAGVSCRQENFSYSHRSVFFLSWLPARQRQDGQFVNDLSTCWRCFGEGGGERGTFLPLDVRLLRVNERGSSVTRNAHSSPRRQSVEEEAEEGGTGLWPNSGHTAGCTSRQLLPVMKNTVWVSAAQEICRSLTAVKVDKGFYEVSSDSLFYSCLLKSYPRVCFPPWGAPTSVWIIHSIPSEMVFSQQNPDNLALWGHPNV